MTSPALTSHTVGVDMATDPRRTAAVVVAWNPGSARIVELCAPCADDDIARLARLGTLAIDCALGWPEPFVDFLVDVREGRDPVVADADGAAWRTRLSMRATDLHVHRATGRRPLSVAADLLGLVAIRTASVLARLREEGVDARRDGSGSVAEVYPAAALRLWGIATAGYKRDSVVRERILADLARRMPWLDRGGFDARLAASDHALDALLCALLARAVDRGLTGRPPPELADAAEREGWIHLPTTDPEALLDR